MLFSFSTLTWHPAAFVHTWTWKTKQQLSSGPQIHFWNHSNVCFQKIQMELEYFASAQGLPHHCNLSTGYKPWKFVWVELRLLKVNTKLFFSPSLTIFLITLKISSETLVPCLFVTQLARILIRSFLRQCWCWYYLICSTLGAVRSLMRHYC